MEYGIILIKMDSIGVFKSDAIYFMQSHAITWIQELNHFNITKWCCQHVLMRKCASITGKYHFYALCLSVSVCAECTSSKCW